MDIKKIMKKYFTNHDYYSILNVLEQSVCYNLLLSARDTGKSYQVKHYVVLDALLNNKYFIYLRRYGVETRTAMVNSYWGDINLSLVNKICGTDYDAIQVTAGEIFACKYENNTLKRTKKIGRVGVLATAGHLKSNVFKDYGNIVYEEVITEQGYLIDEPRLLMDFISTVFRDNAGTVFLLGNLITRDFPYIREWGLADLFNLKTGDIKIYLMEDVKILVEICSNTAEKRSIQSMFFGRAKKNIVEGEYVTQEQPHLPFEYRKSNPIYKLTLEHMHLKYRLEVLEYEKQICLYVHPCTDTITRRVITREWQYDILSTRYLEPLTEGDDLVLGLINSDCVYFSDNLTGTEFRRIIKDYIGRGV